MWDTAEEVKVKLLATFFSGFLHSDVQVLDDQLELIHNSSVRTQGVI